MKDAALRCAAAVVLFACLPVTQGVLAQAATTGDPTTWWPDPITGLMWAGTMHTNAEGTPSRGYGFPWQVADTYCANLKLGGFSNWRLPTLDEVKAATELRKSQACMSYAGRAYPELDVYKGLFFKGRKDVAGLDDAPFWTSTSETGEYWWVPLDTDPERLGYFRKASPDMTNSGALCVRPMDPQMSALAQESHADVPISTIQDLQAYVAVSKARTSFAAGKYSDSLQQAQSAVQLKPNFIPALMGIGLSSGMLGQWNQAVSYIQTALNMDKSNPALKTDLKWAKNGQKIAAKGKQPNGKTPVWNLWTPASTDSKLPATSCS